MKKPITKDEPLPGLSDPGPLPELIWVEKDKFIVDEHYQRSTKSRASRDSIAIITAQFCWSRFSPPTATPAGDTGKYIVIDGQHRIEAVRGRPDILKIPVYVVPEMSRQAQAATFVSINQQRVALTPLNLYRAQLTMGDQMALRVQEVCEEADVAISRYALPGGLTKPRETMALGTIKKGLDRYGDAPVIAALMIVPDTFKLTPGMMRAATLLALMEFFHVRGVENVCRDKLRKVLMLNDPLKRESEARLSARDNATRPHDEMVKALNEDYDELGG
jgi:hypothetical protein